MPLFHYKAIGHDGKEKEGTMEAVDKFALFDTFRKEGATVTSIHEEKVNFGSFSFISLVPFLNKVGAHDKIMFAQNLSSMIDAGLPITRALSVMDKQLKAGYWKKVIGGLDEKLSKGMTLSDAMKDYPNVFSTLFISTIKAGEESGNMSSALKNIGIQLDKTYQLVRKVRGAMMYPAVIFSLMIVIGILMMVYMVPTLSETFTGLHINLPLTTRMIIGTSNFLRSYFGFVAGGLIVVITAFSFWIRTSRGQRILDFVILHSPIIGPINQEINSARTARTLSSLLSAGVEIVVAMDVTKDVLQNSYYKEVISQIESAVQKGEQISTVFLANEKLYPTFVGEMVAVGEETGKIGETLKNVAEFYEDEVDQKTKDMSSVIEPLLMIIIGTAVGFFALSMLSPMYSLANTL